MSHLEVHLALFLFSLSTSGSLVRGIDDGLCNLAKEYCVSSACQTESRRGNSNLMQGPQGKVGPPGPPGPRADVDYKAIDQKIKHQVEEAESKLHAKIEGLEKIVNELQAIVKDSEKTGGLFEFHPPTSEQEIEMYCDLETDRGGWTVFQRRKDGSVNFIRNWKDYVRGFGERLGEFWLGLEALHQLTKGGEYELRIDITDWDDEKTYAKYSMFSVGNSCTRYRINVGEYSGDAGDSLSYSNGESFSTRDADHDSYEDGNCAGGNVGGWWYKDCGFSKLNGKYYKGGQYKARYFDGVVWFHLKKHWEYSLKAVEMKFRRKV